MPFTPSHVAAVLPARWVGLPLSALAVGAMVPDLPYFFVVPALEETLGQTHTARGIVTVDLALGLLAWLVWKVVLEAPAAALAPRWVRSRLPEAWRPGLRAAVPDVRAGCAVLAALALGAFTHVAWDALTHLDAWGPTHIAALRAEVVPGYTGARVVQYLSSVLGLVVLAIAVALWVRRTPPRPVPDRPGAWVGAVVVVGAGLVMGSLAALGTVLSGQGRRRALFDAATVGGAAVLGTALVVAVAWHLVARSDPARVGPAGRASASTGRREVPTSAP